VSQLSLNLGCAAPTLRNQGFFWTMKMQYEDREAIGKFRNAILASLVSS